MGQGQRCGVQQGQELAPVLESQKQHAEIRAGGRVSGKWTSSKVGIGVLVSSS